jgi:hypothetical protein
MELISTDPNQIKLNKTEIRALIKTKFERKVFWHLLLEEYKALERDV